MGDITKSEGRQFAVNAGRGNVKAVGALLRHIVDGSLEFLAGGRNNKLAVEAGTGITGGTGTVFQSSVYRIGGTIKTEILIDVTGLTSADSDLDVIGVEDTTNPCHLGQITTARNGTIFAGAWSCLEAPASLTDLGLYSAGSGVLVYEDLITDESDEIVIVTPAVQAVTDGRVPIANVPAADDYLYLVNGAIDTPDIFTAGKFLLELWGTPAS